MPAFSTVWAVQANENNRFWSRVANRSRSFFRDTTNGVTGLCPDYSSFTGAATAPAWKGADAAAAEEAATQREGGHGAGGRCGLAPASPPLSVACGGAP